eukprot:scaffold26628_cov33-Tisochrysis_lutea.AAC.3
MRAQRLLLREQLDAVMPRARVDGAELHVGARARPAEQKNQDARRPQGRAKDCNPLARQEGPEPIHESLP